MENINLMYLLEKSLHTEMEKVQDFLKDGNPMMENMKIKMI